MGLAGGPCDRVLGNNGRKFSGGDLGERLRTIRILWGLI